jgi:hypothetical protein
MFRESEFEEGEVILAASKAMNFEKYNGENVYFQTGSY